MLNYKEEEILDSFQADTIFRDVTLLALSGFISIVILLLPWLNLKTKQELIKIDHFHHLFLELIHPKLVHQAHLFFEEEAVSSDYYLF